MKIELITLVALAASASAIPMRIITLTGPIPHLSPSELEGVHHPHPPLPHEGEMRIMPHPFAPCHGKGHSSPSPFADLFARLGFGSFPNRPRFDSAVHKHHDHNQNAVVDAWKEYVEHAVGEPARKLVPIMQGGEVRILPFTEDDRVNMEEQDGHGHGQGHGQINGHEYRNGQAGGPSKGRGRYLRPHGGHHWRHKASTFGGRLHRAMLHLSPAEAIALAFVLGAGIGSILHLVFMLFLLSIRRIRGGRLSREQRRQARRERRAARRDTVAVAEFPKDLKEVEVVPGEGEGEGDKLVEKA